MPRYMWRGVTGNVMLGDSHTKPSVDSRFPKRAPYVHISGYGFVAKGGKVDRIRALPLDVQIDIEHLEARIVDLQRDKRQLLEEAWRRADAYVLPKK